MCTDSAFYSICCHFLIIISEFRLTNYRAGIPPKSEKKDNVQSHIVVDDMLFAKF